MIKEKKVSSINRKSLVGSIIEYNVISKNIRSKYNYIEHEDFQYKTICLIKDIYFASFEYFDRFNSKTGLIYKEDYFYDGQEKIDEEEFILNNFCHKYYVLECYEFDTNKTLYISLFDERFMKTLIKNKNDYYSSREFNYFFKILTK